MVAVPPGLIFAGVVPWRLVAVLFERDALLRRHAAGGAQRGVTALPVTYIGAGATFAR